MLCRVAYQAYGISILNASNQVLYITTRVNGKLCLRGSTVSDYMGNDLFDEIFLAAQPLVMLSGVQADSVYFFAGQQSEISTVVAEVSGPWALALSGVRSDQLF